MGIVEPLRITSGLFNVYALPAGDGCILVDAGIPGAVGRVFTALARHGLPPAAIRLIVVTHVHVDHVGALQAIQARCGAPVMVHAAEADLLRQGKVVVPHGTNFYGVAATTLLAGLTRLLPIRFAPYQAEHVVSGGESLADFGLDAAILHTPGHTAGSITVLCASGDAFVGDLAFNHRLFNWGGHYPPFAEDGAAIYPGWQTLLKGGATRIYPGHGRPFPADGLRERL